MLVGSQLSPFRALAGDDTPGTFNVNKLTSAQLKQQILEDVRELGHFRVYYFASHPEAGHTHLVVVNTKVTRVEKVIPVALGKQHGIVLSPGKDPEFAFLCELDGRKAVLVSLRQGQAVATIAPSLPGHFFSGHAAFSHDGKSLFVPEFPEHEGDAKGAVLSRAVPSLAVVRQYDTGSYRPHNLLVSHDGTKLLVGHYGRRVNAFEPAFDGGLSLLEISTGKRLPIAQPDNPYWSLCHIEADDRDNVFISTRSWVNRDDSLISPVLFGNLSGKRWEVLLPEEIKERFRFNFSLRLAQKSNRLAVAHSQGQMVTLWDTRKRKLLHVVDLDKDEPLGVEVTPDERYFLVNTKGGQFLFVDVKTGKIAKRSWFIGLGHCAHITVSPV